MESEINEIRAEEFQNLGIPRVIVRGLCTHQGNLFVEYSSEQGEMDRQYALPGGQIKWGERAKDALRRIFKDEFSMDVTVDRFLLVIENKFGTRVGRIHNVEIVFEVKAQSADFNPMVAGLAGRWIEMNAIDKYNLMPEELREVLFTQSINRRKHIIAGDLKNIR